MSSMAGVVGLGAVFSRLHGMGPPSGVQDYLLGRSASRLHCLTLSYSNLPYTAHESGRVLRSTSRLYTVANSIYGPIPIPFIFKVVRLA
jgi:hypothetical protein